MPAQNMTSSKPYLLRALWEWIIDNDMTPHVIVDVETADMNLPDQSVKDGRMVLNVSPLATRDLEMGNEALTFQARFAGASREIMLPMSAILAIYARENGQGMMFASGDDEPEPPEEPDRPEGPQLRVIK